MPASIESSALYMLITAVPLVQRFDSSFISPALLLTTAWCLGVSYGVWQLLLRRSRKSHPA